MRELMTRKMRLRFTAPLLGLAALLALPIGLAAQATKTAARESAAAAAPPEAVPAAHPGQAEQAYYKALDAAIAPVRGFSAPADEQARIRDVAAALAASDLGKLKAAADGLRDPIAIKLALWLRLKAGVGEAPEYDAFLADSAGWPERHLVRQRRDEAFFTGGGSSKAIRQAYKAQAPETGIGLAALASAFLAEGNTEAAGDLARRAWRDHEIPSTLEHGFLDRFGRFLTVSDHVWRLNRLLMDDPRWTADRASRASLVRRLIPLLPEAERVKAEARLAVYLRAADASQRLGSIASESDYGVLFQKIDLFRHTNREADAARLLLSAPTDPSKIVSPDAWWSQRRAAAYTALNAGNAKLAYDLVKDAGPLTVNPLKDQQALAGFIALRLLNEPRLAEAHFVALAKAADGPLSRARANYWLGRTREALGDAAGARAFYEKATRDPDTFHALLARFKLAPGNHALALPLPALPTAEEIQRFNASEPVRALALARLAGLTVATQHGFLIALEHAAKSEGEAAMIAHLALAYGDTQMAVRIAKSAVARGLKLYLYGYPTHALPAFKPLSTPPERAFLLAVGRQETEFNPATVSGAGARGLLQVMPVTAQHVCHDYKVKCDIPRLLTDNVYNVTMASTYIADRMREFNNSYVLGIAGYNAGPGRARQWIGQFGDPRDPAIDPVDWIHRIPFEETREYVQKVMANIVVYRARLGDPAANRLDEDLARARGTARSPVPLVAAAPAAAEPSPATAQAPAAAAASDRDAFSGGH